MTVETNIGEKAGSSESHLHNNLMDFFPVVERHRKHFRLDRCNLVKTELKIEINQFVVII